MHSNTAVRTVTATVAVDMVTHIRTIPATVFTIITMARAVSLSGDHS